MTTTVLTCGTTGCDNTNISGRGMCAKHYSQWRRAGRPDIDLMSTRIPGPAQWSETPACVGADPELFFPEGTSGPALSRVAEAKTVCGGCPVRAACLAWALDSGQDHGVWGGMTSHERRDLRAAAQVIAATTEPETDWADWTKVMDTATALVARDATSIDQRADVTT